MQNLISEFETMQLIEEEKSSHYQHYNFVCKCQQIFDSFKSFEKHCQREHNCSDLRLTNLVKNKNNTNWAIKFFWKLTCPKCQRQFSSSLCNADLQVKGNNINLVKKWKLQCKRCKKPANFDQQPLLNKFLVERVKQKLIYSKYYRNFAQYHHEDDNLKRLKHHEQKLCEKCKKLGKYCGGDN